MPIKKNKIHRPEDVNDPNAYAIEVDDNSMEPFIKPGHSLLCTTDSKPKNGDYVVVHLVSGEITVKEFHDNNKNILLKGINPLDDPILLEAKDVRVIHKVKWIKRN